MGTLNHRDDERLSRLLLETLGNEIASERSLTEAVSIFSIPQPVASTSGILYRLNERSVRKRDLSISGGGYRR